MDTSGYSPGDPKPLAGYAVLTGAFNALAVGLMLVQHRRRQAAPERIELRDLALVAVATHKLSRQLAKDRVTSFLRAPFTRFQEDAGHGEVEEEARGEGLQRAVGELLICPYCLGQWVATGFVAGLVLAPKATRTVAGVYAALTIADVLQLGYKALEDKAS